MDLIDTTIILIFVFLVGLWIGRITGPSITTVNETHVHLPEGTAPEGLPEGAPLTADARGKLWWSVYSLAVDNGLSYPEDDATEAVEAVYGKAS